MLKIVDYYPNTKIPFPLKELKKFGFDFVVEGRIKEYRHRETKEQLVIDAETREIIIEDLSVWCIIDNELELLFDLIQAGLVEKINDEK